MIRIFTIWMLSVGSLVQAQTSPYAGQESNPIKSLTPQQVSQYLSGAGMGYARAAELNHYPGPRHVIELAESLELTETQLTATREIEAQMKTEAMRLGERRVELERELDSSFANGVIDEAKLAALLERIARVEGEIRFVHLRAHLAQAEVLSSEQILLYDRLRGYSHGHHGPAH